MDFVKYLCERYGIGNITPDSFERLVKASGMETKCEFSRYAGYALCMPYFEKYYIAYSNNMPKWVEIYMALHEVSHVLLGHLDGLSVVSGKCQEEEARIFSTVLVAFMLLEEWKEGKRK